MKNIILKNPIANTIIEKTSAWLPIAMSLAMLVIMLGIFSMSGFHPVRQADEGVGAHLFQIWLVLEAFSIPFFALTWLPQKPKEALLILAIQVTNAFIVCFPVYYFKL